MQNSPRVNINLIGKDKGLGAQDIFKWIETVGKVIIIVTELIALAALSYRFYIDRKIIDLHDQIKREQLFVKSFEKKEEIFRSIQTRLENIKKTEEITNTKLAIMDEISRITSEGQFSSTNLTVDLNSISIDGLAFSVFPINNFVETLKRNISVTSISIDDIASTSQGIRFKMTIELKENRV